VIPRTTTTITAVALTASPEMTALAARHISASPAVRSFSLNIGINAAVSAPSPNSRRNRFGMVNATAKAPATGLIPMKDA
jgi:hypothetical protein